MAEHERGNQATWPSVMRQVAATAGQDYRERLEEIDAPALVINGALDPVITLERWDPLAHGLPVARQLVVPGIGHMVLEEAPDEVARAVLDFLPPAE